MGGFIRIRNLCCCGGSLKAASIAIGIFYVLLAALGVSLGENSLLVNSDTGGAYGKCGQGIFLPLLKETSYVSGIVNLCMLYGIITYKPSFIAAWLAWNIPYPFIQIIHIIWSVLLLLDCEGMTDLETAGYAILICNAVSSVFLLYFAMIIYSLYKDIQEGEGRNRSNKAWEQEMAPYNVYPPPSGATTPTNWGTLPLSLNYKGPAPPPPVQRQQSAGLPRLQFNQNTP